jgi:hypothetical protein
VLVTVGVTVTVGVFVAVQVLVGAGVFVQVGVFVAVKVLVGVEVGGAGVNVWVGVLVGVNVAVTVFVGVNVCVGVTVGVEVMVAVGGTLVGVLVGGFDVAVAVSVGVAVLVDVAVLVGVDVFVMVAAAVFVGVDGSVGVNVFVAVAVGLIAVVAVFVAVGLPTLVGVLVGAALIVIVSDIVMPFNRPVSVTLPGLTALSLRVTPDAPPGTCACAFTPTIAALEDVSLTSIPPRGAIEFRRTVRLKYLPTYAVSGTEIFERAGGLTVTLVVLTMPWLLAVRVTTANWLEARVLTVVETVEWPALTISLYGGEMIDGRFDSRSTSVSTETLPVITILMVMYPPPVTVPDALISLRTGVCALARSILPDSAIPDVKTVANSIAIVMTRTNRLLFMRIPKRKVLMGTK